VRSGIACLVFALIALVGAQSGSASTVGAGTSPSLYYPNEAAAKNPKTGIPSWDFSPQTTTTFQFPTSSSVGDYDEITLSGKATTGKQFNATIFGWTYTHKRSSAGVHIWTWQHYTEWAGNGTCVTNRIANNQWSSYQGALWHYRGAGGYYNFTINPCNTVWSGNQGHYDYCALACIQDDFPWELGEGYAWGNYRTFDWGCTGACG